MLIKSLALAALTMATVSVADPVEASTRCGGTSHYGVGDGYAWRTTASGRPMDPYANITAHRSLPFGTRLRVTNQSNGKSVVVTVLDRGPFVAGRVLDLSYGAFSRIASPSSGVASVCYSRI
jgi:rare lipoprotein A